MLHGSTRIAVRKTAARIGTVTYAKRRFFMLKEFKNRLSFV